MSGPRLTTEESPTNLSIAKRLKVAEEKQAALSALELEEMLLRGEEEFFDFMEKRTVLSKSADIMAEINIGTDAELDELLENASPSLKAFLLKNTNFKPSPVYAKEHAEPIGQLDKPENKRTAPSITKLSNIPIQELDWKKYGIDLVALAAKYKLEALKLTGDLIQVGNELIPDLDIHHASGDDQKAKDRRISEQALIEEVIVALLKVHKKIYFSGDGQENPMKVSKDGKSLVKGPDGRMVMSDAPKAMLDRFSPSKLQVTSIQYGEYAKYKERGYRINSQFAGPSPWSNQQNKLKGGMDLKLFSMVIERPEPGSTTPNSEILKSYSLPPVEKLDTLANSKLVYDHPPVKKTDKITDEKNEKTTEITRLVNGGVSLDGPKGFTPPEELFVPEAFDSKGEVKEEVLEAGEKCFEKLYKLLVTSCAKVALRNPTEVPNVDQKAIPNPQTSQKYLEDFHATLCSIGINPFKPTSEIKFDFSDQNQVKKLAEASQKLGLDPVTSQEKMAAVFESKNDVDTRKLCLALREVGVDPYKTDEDMMKDHDFTDEDNQVKLVDAVNDFLKVQAIEKSAGEASLITDLRKIFTDQFKNLLASDEFQLGYIRWVKNPKHWYKGAVEDFMQQAHVERQIELFNGKTIGTSGRSPIDQLVREAFGLELSGGFLRVAGSTKRDNHNMRVALLYANSADFARAHINGNEQLVQSITETSTKELGLDPKKQKGAVARVYASTIMSYETSYLRCQQRLQLLQQKSASNDATPPPSPTSDRVAGNRHGSFSPRARESQERVLVDQPSQQNADPLNMNRKMGH